MVAALDDPPRSPWYLRYDGSLHDACVIFMVLTQNPGLSVVQVRTAFRMMFCPAERDAAGRIIRELVSGPSPDYTRTSFPAVDGYNRPIYKIGG